MSATVAFMQPKGSTAKSTTVAATAHLLGKDRRVLVVDLDPQGDVTGWLGGRRDTAGITQAVKATVANDPAAWPGVDEELVLADMRAQVGRTVQHTPHGVDLICADLQAHVLVKNWKELGGSDSVLATMVACLAPGYDVVLLDTKGDMGVLTEAAMHAATSVVGVAEPNSKTAVEGLDNLAAHASRAGCSITAVVPVKVQSRSRGALADDLYQDMKAQWPTTPAVRFSAEVGAAALAGEPITAWAPRSAVSQDYEAVVADLMAKGVLS